MTQLSRRGCLLDNFSVIDDVAAIRGGTSRDFSPNIVDHPVFHRRSIWNVKNLGGTPKFKVTKFSGTRTRMSGQNSAAETPQVARVFVKFESTLEFISRF